MNIDFASTAMICPSFLAEILNTGKKVVIIGANTVCILIVQKMLSAVTNHPETLLLLS